MRNRKSREKEKFNDYKRIERQRLKNNILGIFIAIIILWFALDIGGCSSILTDFITSNS